MQQRMRTPIVRTYSQHIAAPPEVVYPLLCPVRARDWLHGWAERCEVLWSASGIAERGCVFRTVEPGRPATIWTTSEHDPDRGALTFARVTEGLNASTLQIRVDPDGEGASTVAIRFMVVPTSAAGVADAEARYEHADLLDSIAWCERSMNHFLRTGRLLRRGERDVTSRTPKE